MTTDELKIQNSEFKITNKANSEYKIQNCCLRQIILVLQERVWVMIFLGHELHE